jgi:hypothetical protein
LLLAKKMGALEREGRELQSRIIDLSGDLAKALRERDTAQHSKALTLEEQRAQSRENWQAYRQEQERQPGKSGTQTQPHTLKPNEDSGGTDDKEKGQGLILPDNDLSL